MKPSQHLLMFGAPGGQAAGPQGGRFPAVPDSQGLGQQQAVTLPGTLHGELFPASRLL